MHKSAFTIAFHISKDLHTATVLVTFRLAMFHFAVAALVIAFWYADQLNGRTIALNAADFRMPVAANKQSLQKLEVSNLRQATWMRQRRYEYMLPSGAA